MGIKVGEGRGSAIGRGVAVAAVIGLVMMSQLESVEAAVYDVGGSSGWTFNVQNWPKGIRFRAGDILKFNYDSSIHNVVVVNKAGYASCKTPGGAKVYNTGSDQIKLPKGQSYFICNFPGHCEAGMKIAVNAL
ncbi:basic blue protein-like [Cucumis melo var. makuwa]|uniref:Basic blue protein-like n=2 Tax=Cucumis melo TaxID=3656 RepID=A0A1S3B4N7_CUCME|nr:basic blue protein-like [Cucumis melo]KAA0058846.1 basic blue protein-like [Cucumis melo var. makuwa]TYK23773.1 basic blue protein-like [Cucumis melo var. makuwa]